MKDRIPTKPGRVKLTPSGDGENYYILERADEPSETGTPLNKASLLSDATAALMGLTGADPTVNDALASVGGRFTMVKTGAVPPGLAVEAKSGDIYIEDGGTGGRFGRSRHPGSDGRVYLQHTLCERFRHLSGRQQCRLGSPQGIGQEIPRYGETGPCRITGNPQRAVGVVCLLQR